MPDVDPVMILVQGLVALVALAVVIGVLEGRSRGVAWQRIADARRILRERSDELDERERDIEYWEHRTDPPR